MFAEGDRADIQVGERGLKALLAYVGPDVNPAVLIQRRDNTRLSSLAPSIAAVPKSLLSKTPEAQT
jgi:mannose-6-phosphate isomerase